MRISSYEWTGKGVRTLVAADVGPLRDQVLLQVPSLSAALPTDCELQDLQERGVTAIEIGDRVDLRDAAQTMAFFRFLRDATRHRLRVIWGGRGGMQQEAEMLFHLYPPEQGIEGAQADQAQRWADAYHYGLYYWRQGPEFVLLRDRRPFPWSPATVTIGNEMLLSVFEQTEFPTARQDIKGGEWVQAAVAELAKAKIVWTYEDLVLRLPYRIGRWPIPAQEV